MGGRSGGPHRVDGHLDVSVLAPLFPSAFSLLCLGLLVLTIFFADLTTLHFRNIKLLHPPSLFCFPSLTSLALDRATIPLSVLPLLLSVEELPALRALAFTAHNAPDPPNQETFAVFAGCPLERLDLLQLHVEDEPSFPVALFRHAVPIFLSTPSTDSLSYTLNVAHIRILPIVANETLTNVIAFSYADFVHTARSLRSLHLPSVLHPSLLLDRGNEDLSVIMTDLLVECDLRRVEVRWYEEEDCFAVSPSLWQYAKSLKEKETEQRTEGGE
jgi:hypothetical protein